MIFRTDFKEGQIWKQLCNGKIDEKAKHLYTGLYIAHGKISKHIEITILPHTTVANLLRIWHIWGEQEHQLGLFTEYTPFKSKKELFLANSEYKQNVINILRKILVEEGCSTMQASGIMQMS